MKLEHIFEEYKSSKWFFVRPGGNWGDYLIYSGAEALADKVGLDWRTVDSDSFAGLSDADSKCVYLHGGGGYNSWCSGRSFIELEHATSLPFKVIVQGPCTLEENNQSIINRILSACSLTKDTRICFFTREKVSENIALDLTQFSEGRIEAYCDHDTALQLTRSDILEIARMDHMPRPRYKLFVIREDQESPEELSGRFGLKQVYMDPARRANSYEQWLRIHLSASEIVSNRLHSAILGCILGKTVTVSGGSYHKNHSIWSFSLKDRGVNWCETESFPKGGVQLPTPFRQSYRMNRLIKWINRVQTL